MATEEKVASYLDMSDDDDGNYKRFTLEIFSPFVPKPIRGAFDIGKDVPDKRVRRNGYVEEYIMEKVDEYVSSLKNHIVIQITGEDGKVVDTFYPYGQRRQYCKDCHHAEKLPDGRLCRLSALGGAPTPIRKGEYELIEACAMFRPKEEADE